MVKHTQYGSVLRFVLSLKVIFALVLVLLSGCSTTPSAINHPQAFTAEGNHSLYIVNHGWHTGLIVPAEGLKASLPQLKERFSQADYLELGWGDKGFYQAKEITTGLTIQAIFWPTESVMHVVAVPEDVHGYFGGSEMVKLCLSDTELASLNQFIQKNFAKDDLQNLIPTKNGIYGDSQFYKGEGDYYLMNTCNKWTAKGLQSIGMSLSPTFKLTSGSIMGYLSDHPLSRSADFKCE